MDMGLREILQHLALVEAEHVYGLAHVYCAASADGDNAVAAVFAGEVSALIHERSRGIGLDLFKVNAVNSVLGKRFFDRIGNSGAA